MIFFFPSVKDCFNRGNGILLTLLQKCSWKSLSHLGLCMIFRNSLNSYSILDNHIILFKWSICTSKKSANLFCKVMTILPLNYVSTGLIFIINFIRRWFEFWILELPPWIYYTNFLSSCNIVYFSSKLSFDFFDSQSKNFGLKREIHLKKCP